MSQLELLEEAAWDKSECNIVLRNEIMCTIQGLKPHHRQELVKTWSIMVEGAYFMPLYKTGAWDGKIQYVKNTGNTYIHLLDEIVPWIIERGYKIKVVDNRLKLPYIPKPIDSGFLADCSDVILRYYQVEAINAAIKHGYGILKLATGAGKTYINAGLVKAYGDLRSFTIVPNTDLVKQTAISFEKVGLDTGVYYGKKKDPDHQHVIGTWQALKNNLDLLNDIQVMVVDEVHGAKASVLFKMLTEGPGSKIQYRFGMTGTIPKGKSDKVALKAALGPVIYDLSAKELMDKKYLASLDIHVMQMQDCSIKHMSWDAEKAFLSRNKRRLAAVAELAESLTGNTLILIGSIKGGETLQTFIEGSTFLYGDTDSDVREEHYGSFADGDDKTVIATFGIAQAGIDIERVFNLILVDAGKTFVRTIQSIGRGLRKAADKHHVNVLDICSNGKYSSKHMKERVRYYKEAQYPHRVDTIDIGTDFDD